jgi:hypothetical protein
MYTTPEYCYEDLWDCRPWAVSLLHPEEISTMFNLEQHQLESIPKRMIPLWDVSLIRRLAQV